MKPLRHIKSGFTMTELAIVIAVVALLMVIFIPAQMQGKIKTKRNACVNNLIQIHTSYRVWNTGPHYQMQDDNIDGGWRTTITNPNPERFVWTNYSIMQSMLGANPAIVICPADERKPAVDFSLVNFNNNSSVSYFVGVYANDNYPQCILGGDRNLAGSAKDKSYGYSPTNGFGFDTATIPLRNSTTNIFWSRQMHSVSYSEGAGNVLLGDGSVQQVSSDGFRRFLLLKNGDQSNPTAESNGVVRLLIP